MRLIIVIRNIFSGFIAILIGFFFAINISTILGQTGDWGIFSAAIIVAFLELTNKIVYELPKSKKLVKEKKIKDSNLFLVFINNLKIGFIYGLFVDAFKVGS